MPAISNLTRSRATQATIDVAGEPVTIVFDAAKITPGWRREVLSSDDPLAIPSALAGLILQWDVTADDGAAFPPTGENLARFDFVVLGAILEKLIEAAQPSRAEGNASGSSLSTAATDSTAAPGSLLNGHQPSPSLTPSASPSLT
jgi:hypothetical protein